MSKTYLAGFFLQLSKTLGSSTTFSWLPAPSCSSDHARALRALWNERGAALLSRRHALIISHRRPSKRGKRCHTASELRITLPITYDQVPAPLSPPFRRYAAGRVLPGTISAAPSLTRLPTAPMTPSSVSTSHVASFAALAVSAARPWTEPAVFAARTSPACDVGSRDLADRRLHALRPRHLHLLRPGYAAMPTVAHRTELGPTSSYCDPSPFSTPLFSWSPSTTLPPFPSRALCFLAPATPAHLSPPRSRPINPSSGGLILLGISLPSTSSSASFVLTKAQISFVRRVHAPTFFAGLNPSPTASYVHPAPVLRVTLSFGFLPAPLHPMNPLPIPPPRNHTTFPIESSHPSFDPASPSRCVRFTSALAGDAPRWLRDHELPLPWRYARLQHNTAPSSAHAILVRERIAATEAILERVEEVEVGEEKRMDGYSNASIWHKLFGDRAQNGMYCVRTFSVVAAGAATLLSRAHSTEFRIFRIHTIVPSRFPLCTPNIDLAADVPDGRHALHLTAGRFPHPHEVQSMPHNPLWVKTGADPFRVSAQSYSRPDRKIPPTSDSVTLVEVAGRAKRLKQLPWLVANISLSQARGPLGLSGKDSDRSKWSLPVPAGAAFARPCAAIDADDTTSAYVITNPAFLRVLAAPLHAPHTLDLHDGQPRRAHHAVPGSRFDLNEPLPTSKGKRPSAHTDLDGDIDGGGARRRADAERGSTRPSRAPLLARIATRAVTRLGDGVAEGLGRQRRDMQHQRQLARSLPARGRGGMMLRHPCPSHSTKRTRTSLRTSPSADTDGFLHADGDDDALSATTSRTDGDSVASISAATTSAHPLDDGERGDLDLDLGEGEGAEVSHGWAPEDKLPAEDGERLDDTVVGFLDEEQVAMQADAARRKAGGGGGGARMQKRRC
ncbi:hypothetical protein B0H14DRAFT_3468134 [Mycena olivaceomarginata]|nr:hypothetical protein B0H14DRAFT_3468134 [Mycena olivaceomarginata]